MKRELNSKCFSKWVESVGGPHQATALIIQHTNWSVSKSEQIATSRYRSAFDKPSQNAMSELTGMDLEDLFRPTANRAKAS